jgi:hypothetical protein
MGCYSPYNNWPWSACFMLVSCLAYSSTLKMKAIFSSKMSIDFQWTTWRSIPNDRTGFDSQYSHNFFSFLPHTNQCQDIPSLQSKRKFGHFPQSRSICSMKLTTHIHLVPRLGIHEALLLFGLPIHIRLLDRTTLNLLYI